MNIGQLPFWRWRKAGRRPTLKLHCPGQCGDFPVKGGGFVQREPVPFWSVQGWRRTSVQFFTAGSGVLCAMWDAVVGKCIGDTSETSRTAGGRST